MFHDFVRDFEWVGRVSTTTSIEYGGTMVTLSNENGFRDFKDQWHVFWYILQSWSKQMVKQTVESLVIWDARILIVTSL